MLWVVAMLMALTLQAQKRVLVISGGGARGAWGGGVAQALHEVGNDYDVIIGTSTGSLLAPLALIDSFQTLRQAYTTVTPKDIFNVNPFKTRGKNKDQLRPIHTLWRILWGRKTLGESKNLKKTIMSYLTPERYAQIQQAQGKEFIVTVINLNRDVVEYKSSRDYGYEDMVNWIWASANQPVFMSLCKHPDASEVNQYYVDGGVRENIPLKKAVEVAHEIGAKNIDVIIHSTPDSKLDTIKNMRILKLLLRTIDLYGAEVKANDIDFVKYIGVKCDQEVPKNPRDIQSEDIIVSFYFMPEEDFKSLPHSLSFEPKGRWMNLWHRGMGVLADPNYKKQYFVRKYLKCVKPFFSMK